MDFDFSHMGLSYDKDSQLLSMDLPTIDTAFYQKAIDLKGFYTELNNVFVAKSFKDLLGEGKKQKKGKYFDNQVKVGEFKDEKNFSRIGNIWEKRFYHRKKYDGSYEIEIGWAARKGMPENKNAWMEWNMDLVCRFIQDVEAVVGDKKVKLQSGKWEFRNKYVYKNNIIQKYLSTVPFVKNSKMMQNFYMNQIHRKAVERDVEFCVEKLQPLINGIIKKHFA